MPSLKPASLDIDQPKINLYAEITGDPNPIHTDPAFAATTEMGGVIAHGTLSANLIWQAARETFGPQVGAGAKLDIKFLRPVRVGDRVTASGDQAADGTWQVWVKNQNDETVIAGTLTLPG
ncbi:MAG: MaoC family dehydratase [Alphaproteobacteria bacterium]